LAAFIRSKLDDIAPVLRAPVERGEIAGLVALAARQGDIHVEVHGLRDLKSGAPITPLYVVVLKSCPIRVGYHCVSIA